jgi:uncharacterized protein YbcI
MNTKALKVKQIENLLSQKIQNVYRNQLEHQLDNISCKLFDRTLVIVLEGTVTSSERLLKNSDRQLAEQVREAIDNVIQPQIKEIIEEVLKVKVIDFLSDTTIDNNLTGAIAMFEFQPN